MFTRASAKPITMRQNTRAKKYGSNDIQRPASARARSSSAGTPASLSTVSHSSAVRVSSARRNSARKASALARRASMEAKITAAECNELGLFVCGTAKTVKEKLIGYVKEAGLGNVLALLQFGTLPADLTRRNMERFAESVMPDLRKAAREFHGETATS